ncbi:hypothetical protein EZV62_027137 [Acer yangbiense]|uniref:Uncharacterized protein n=1 Tax=Acer yangbiense TaxID=1000413 RepID=A0A5C7GT97_9ROSI|nr:hypothetical protein EZV62_027137 [Acer yangbiense]
MGTISLHQLSDLTEDECWLLFKELAFGHDTEGHTNLVALGKEIMKKCGGVPLAVKSLGSMMRYKSEENQWQSVVESDLWNLPQDENSILPALRLSYSNLPSKLQQCFAYCAIFPKDFVIEKELLIQLWMANVFISFTEKLDPEDIGNEICNELCWRSFFEDIEKGDDFYYGKRFKMHDLVHDLAQSIMEDECFSKEIESSTNISKRTCHFTSVNSQWNSYPFPKALYQVETLRTFLVRSTGWSSRVQFSCDFSKLSSFRVFGARMVWLTKLSSSISRLKHLRYLDLSLTKIQMLPESICTLYNLQTLELTRCYSLWELPKHMNRLKNLRHLYLGGCYNLSQMPPKIGEITCLKTITWFIVGKKRGCHLAELKDLNLGGYLCIRHLQRVENPLNAKANLIGKRNLRQLGLSWEDDDSDLQSPEDAEKVLEALEPHANLEIFDISGYKGVQFPFWMRDHILNNVVDLSLSDCHNCSHLPPLSLLASLRTLSLSRISRVMHIDDNFQGAGIMRGFPSLQKLTIEDLPSLQMMCIDDNFQGAGIMRGFPSLQNLTIKDLPSFQMMCIDDNFQGAGIMRRFPSLQNLTIEDLPSLQRKFTTLSEGLQHLSCLEKLTLTGCPELVALPDGIKYLNSLQHLQISSDQIEIQRSRAEPCGFDVFYYGRKETIGSPKLAVLPEALRYAKVLAWDDDHAVVVEQDKLHYKEKFEMHDLAQSIMKDECLITEAKSSDNVSRRIFHVTVVTDSEQS